MAAYYPDKPNDNEKRMMSNFIESFAYFYPCKPCAKDLKLELR